MSDPAGEYGGVLPSLAGGVPGDVTLSAERAVEDGGRRGTSVVLGGSMDGAVTRSFVLSSTGDEAASPGDGPAVSPERGGRLLRVDVSLTSPLRERESLDSLESLCECFFDFLDFLCLRSDLALSEESSLFAMRPSLAPSALNVAGESRAACMASEMFCCVMVLSPGCKRDK